MDLPYFRELALNMANGVLSMSPEELTALPDPDIGERMQQLRDEVEEFLSAEIVQQRMSEFEAQASTQGARFMTAHRNPVVEAQREAEEEARRRGGAEMEGGYRQSGVGDSVFEKKTSNGHRQFASSPSASRDRGDGRADDNDDEVERQLEQGSSFDNNVEQYVQQGML